MRLAWLLTLALFFGCSEEPPPPDDDSASEASEEKDSQGHVHPPLMGGKLVEIGAHFAQVEFVLEPKTGTLTAYVWDGHVQHNVDVDGDELDVLVDGRKITLQHVEQGDKFVGRSDMLKDAKSIKGSIPKIVVMDETFEDVTFELRFDDE